MIERLPTPWGLVRLGVAPDHPNLKTVSRAFERIARAAGLPLPRQRRGRQRRVARRARRACTTQSSTRSASQTDRRLGIPGEDLPGSWAATELVAWYNGHPDFQELAFDLSGERAVVVGNGNVALDVARMLALTREELAPTDTTDAAIEAIAGSGIREIVVLGRRGPVQAAWTSTELQEMGELAGADILVDPAELELDPASEAELAASIEHRPAERRDPARLRGAPAGGQASDVRLRFRVSPVAILGEERVEAVEIVRNRLEPDGKGQRARGALRTSARSSRARSSSGASAIAASLFRACRSTRERGRCRTRRARARRARARRFQASTAPAGSSAVRPA